MSDREAFSRLRKKLDSKDGYVSNHQVIKTAGATVHAARMNRVPLRALDDQWVKSFIMAHFPNADSDPEQRRLAGRTVRIIHLYYRVGETIGKVAEELSMSQAMVKKKIHKISQAMNRPIKTVGRPKKNGVSVSTAIEEETPRL